MKNVIKINGEEFTIRSARISFSEILGFINSVPGDYIVTINNSLELKPDELIKVENGMYISVGKAVKLIMKDIK